MALCWIPVLGPALAVIAAIAGIVEAVANIGLAIGGEKSWGEALLSVGFAALGCIGLGGLRGAVSSLKALKNFGGALKAAGGLKGAFLSFAESTIPPGARDALLKFGQRLRIAANRKNLYVKGKTLQPGTKGRDLPTSKAPYGRRWGRKIKSPEEWACIHAPNGKEIYGPAAIEGTERTLSMSDYVKEYGDAIDRVGDDTGLWFSPVKDGKVYSFESRALREGSKDLEYNQLTLPNEIPGLEVKISQVAPNLGHHGGAIQAQFILNHEKISMSELLEMGAIQW
ncbi:glycohydrolase toxin TNT-related protein [Buchananella felis]|uniref:glycohydrolase toxin TNT-related protein n=1 Tax=Buchananella felis TaxID=3231492 RepID=UPI00352790B8